MVILKKRLTSLYEIRFRAAPLFVGCLFVQIMLAALSKLGFHLPIFILLMTFVGIIVGLLFNLRIRGIPIVVFGTLVNLVALALNGGRMPVSRQALLQAGVSVSKQMLQNNTRHAWMTNLHPAWWLGDWIPIPHQVLSPGDVIVAVGVIVFLLANSKRR